MTNTFMSRDDIASFLQRIQSVDNRRVTSETIAAWHDASRRGKWTAGDAVEAMRQHFSESTEWLMPAHITHKVRSLKRDRHPGYVALPAAPETDAARAMRRKVIAEMRERHAQKSR